MRFIVHLNNGMCTALGARELEAVAREAEAVCTKHNCGAAIRDVSGEKSVQVGGVGWDGHRYRYEALTHE